MNKRILLLTKDAMCKTYLPVYGNEYWKDKTPNLDELAKKGTVFNHFIAAAPSTVMSFRAMMTGKFPHEQPYDRYVPKEFPEKDTDFFAVARKQGYHCHIIWDEKWKKMVLHYGNCYGRDTVIHNLHGLRQSVGCHNKSNVPLVPDEEKSKNAINILISEVSEICNSEENVLLWIHLPHVINGRTGYGTDIDLFDQIIGKLRDYFKDENIFISADHGNMNGHDGKYGYGFDVKTPAIEIPLITPRLDKYGESCDAFFSNVDIKDLILSHKVIEREFVFSDCTYYAQPHRKLAIIHNGMVYIYSKLDKKEELYDLMLDPNEETNLIDDIVLDVDRGLTTSIREVYFHPSWERVDRERIILRKVNDEIWVRAPRRVEFIEKIRRQLKRIYRFFQRRLSL